MAVTLTVPQLAAAVRLSTDPTAPVVEPHLGILTRQLAVASEYVDAQAPNAPVETANQAVVQVAGLLLDGMPPAGAYRDSGADALLAPYAVRRAVAI